MTASSSKLEGRDRLQSAKSRPSRSMQNSLLTGRSFQLSARTPPMDRYPDLVELESFFQTASVSEYSSAADEWHYDIRRFEFSSGGEHLVCRFAPADGAIAFNFSADGEARWDIALAGLSSLDLEMSAGRVLLVGRVKTAELEQLFKLAVSPRVTFSLGSTEVLAS